MTFNDVEDLIRLLDEHPRLKSELRLRLFEEEWAPFMKYVREVMASSLAAIEQLKLSIADHDRRLAELQVETSAIRSDLREQTSAIRSEMREESSAIRTELREETTALRSEQASFRVEVGQRFDRVEADIRVLQTDVGSIKGDSLEARFCSRAPAYLQQIILRGKLITLDDIPQVYDALDAGRITQEEYDRIVATDAIVRGRRRDSSELTHMVVEVSATIDENDVARAIRSAEILRRLDVPADPVVFGYVLRPQAKELADNAAVTILLTAPR